MVVEPPWPSNRWIDSVDSVRRRDDRHLAEILEPVGLDSAATREFLGNAIMTKVVWQVTQDADLEFLLNVEFDTIAKLAKPPKKRPQLKTQQTDADVEEFLLGIGDERQREDCFTVLEIMRKATKAEPKMWGPGIVGFGSYHYRYASGREGDSFVTGVSPRKQALTVYIMPGFKDYEELLRRLGKHKTGKSCLYINKLEDVDLGVLERLVTKSVRHMEDKYG